jgi:hypothetical protein
LPNQDDDIYKRHLLGGPSQEDPPVTDPPALSPLDELVEAMAAPSHPDELGVVLGGTVAGFVGALLHSRGIALWLVPLVMAWLFVTATVAVHLLRSVLRHRRTRP